MRNLDASDVQDPSVISSVSARQLERHLNASRLSYVFHEISPLCYWILPTTCEEDAVGIRTLTMYRVILHLSAPSSKPPGLRHESQTKVAPNPGVASTSACWWSLSHWLPLVPRARDTPLGPLETERSVKELPWPLSHLSPFTVSPRRRGVDGASRNAARPATPALPAAHRLGSRGEPRIMYA